MATRVIDSRGDSLNRDSMLIGRLRLGKASCFQNVGGGIRLKHLDRNDTASCSQEDATQMCYN